MSSTETDANHQPAEDTTPPADSIETRLHNAWNWLRNEVHNLVQGHAVEEAKEDAKSDVEDLFAQAKTQLEQVVQDAVSEAKSDAGTGAAVPSAQPGQPPSAGLLETPGERDENGLDPAERAMQSSTPDQQ